MSNIRIDLEATVINGQPLTFKSPVDCAQITGLKVYYPEGDAVKSRVFQFADAHGKNVGSVSLFAENVLVKVILDTDLGRAYIQNADTNAYLEAQFAAARTAASNANTAAATAQSTADAAKTAAANANTTADNAQTAANSANNAATEAQNTANAALPKAGGTMTGQLKVKGLVLTSGTDYGTTLPAAGTAGRIFFKKVT